MDGERNVLRVLHCVGVFVGADASACVLVTKPKYSPCACNQVELTAQQLSNRLPYSVYTKELCVTFYQQSTFKHFVTLNNICAQQQSQHAVVTASRPRDMSARTVRHIAVPLKARLAAPQRN